MAKPFLQAKVTTNENDDVDAGNDISHFAFFLSIYVLQ